MHKYREISRGNLCAEKVINCIAASMYGTDPLWTDLEEQYSTHIAKLGTNLKFIIAGSNKVYMKQPKRY